MGRLLLILLLLGPLVFSGKSQSVTIDDLLNLSSISSRSFDDYMGKKGFLQSGISMKDNVKAISFFEKKHCKQPDSVFVSRSVDLYKKEDTYCFVLHTSSRNEYMDGRNRLKKAGFFYDKASDTSQPGSLLFQKGSISVLANAVTKDGNPVYNFLLQKKEFPDPGSVRFAEDLLKFDSHEHLISYFGEDNVKKDVYFFSEKESKKCSVLFPNSSRQAVFIWDDEDNLYKVSFILISGTISTNSAVKYSGNFSQNTWMSKNGVYSGMRMKDLLKLNMNDFKFYGQNSEFSFMVVPEKTRYVDFTKLGVMLDCFDCHGSPMLNTEKVSAADAADHDLSLYVSCLMIRPTH
jgi:general stress protein 26